MILAIDAGNSRIKWGLHDGDAWREQGSAETARAGSLAAAFGGLRAVDSVIASNVAGDALRETLTALLPDVQCPVRWIRSTREQCGVRNGYREPLELGSDRWAALIGAWTLHGGAAVVVNAGTALTVDALSGDGVFLGGFIAPGTELMLEALARNTAALRRQPGAFSYFPDSTGNAITSGAINAQCGAIERMAAFLEDTGAAAPVCILSGGGAELLQAHLKVEVRLVDRLVLAGLVAIARDSRPSRPRSVL